MGDVRLCVVEKRVLDLPVTGRGTLLGDQEGSGHDWGEEGTETEGEVEGVHVGAAVPALPDVEDDHVPDGVDVTAAEPSQDGTDVDGEKIGAVRIGSQGTAHEYNVS